MVMYLSSSCFNSTLHAAQQLQYVDIVSPKTKPQLQIKAEPNTTHFFGEEKLQVLFVVWLSVLNVELH